MIEELLERYFEGETSAAEEKRIRAFFASGEVDQYFLADDGGQVGCRRHRAGDFSEIVADSREAGWL